MFIEKILSRMDICEVRFKKRTKEQKPSILREFIDEPEKFQLNAFVENDEIVIKINKRELEP